MQKELLTKKNYAEVGQDISHEMAADFVKAYEETHAGEVRGYYICRNMIDQILAQPGCVGMNFYYGMNQEGQKTLVYMGVDADGKDLVKKTVILNNGTIKEEEAIVADFVTLVPWWR